jgi:sugar/nucleoside kinase (ribokinase family)
MAEDSLDVVGIGNAIVDVLAQTDDAFLAAQDLPKGAMTLIDAGRAEELYAAMGPGVEVSGGSAANTLAGLAALGGRGGFVGKVRNDQLGGIFRHDIRATGVTFRTPAATDGAPTARCLIFVTRDAQRTMATYLGASVELGPDDLDPEMIAAAKVTYLEGYLWDAPAAKEAFLAAARQAHEAGRKVALSLSDPFCVERHRDSFVELIGGHVDILFANEHEVCSLFQAADFDRALQAVRGHCEIAALTRSAKGAVVLSGDEVHVIDAAPVDDVVDTTGAGDLFAAGFLYGYTRGEGLYDCGRIGAVAAAEVISHFGARPEAPLDRMISERMAAG